MHLRSIRQKSQRFSIITSVWIVLLTAPLAADELKDALTKGKPSLDLRYRFELVDQEGKARQAKASTLRLRLGYTTKSYQGFSLHLDFEAVRAVGFKDYNSTGNGKLEFPVIADPEDSELNQAFLAYEFPGRLHVKLGRQRIKLDNDRFIGNVGWRQNEQTFDAVTLVSRAVPRTTLTFAHVENVNRIFGEHHPTMSDLDLRAELFHAHYASRLGGISIYGYFIENEDAPEGSHQNYGIRLTGNRRLSESFRFLYALEYAEQSPFRNGTRDIDADYSLFEVGGSWKGFTIKYGREKLNGSGTYAFQTPLATLHALNGWADIFLTTPSNGLVDRYYLLGYRAELGDRPLVLRVRYHRFESDSASIDYGLEWDVLAQYELCEGCALLVKYAAYSAHEYASDTKKFWTSFQYKF